MQLSASLNLFGVEPSFFTQTDKYGNIENVRNEIVGKSWVIQPKFETPHMNFNDEGVHPIRASAGNLALPANYGKSAVPRGMWHQFGVMEADDKGIFIEIGDIPKNWLQYHYDVIGPSGSVYNNYIDSPNDPTSTRAKVYQKMQSLTELLNFDANSRIAKLGQVAESKTIREGIVAIPYVIESVNIKNSEKNKYKGEYRSTRKKFVEIPQQRWLAANPAIEGSSLGDSLQASGESIRKLLEKMQRYVLPPQFDFINNKDVDPIVMYIFEFEHEFDKDDLAFMWQNTAPREYEKIELKYESIAHELMDLELLNEDIIMNNENLRWMVFKVKQRSQVDYFDKVVNQLSADTTQTTQGYAGDMVFGSANTVTAATKEAGYNIAFNWPYDYVSFVEMVKFDAEILYKQDINTSSDEDVVIGQTNSPTGFNQVQGGDPTATQAQTANARTRAAPTPSRQQEAETQTTNLPSGQINMGGDY
jgi:hypothetical protein